MLSLGLGVALVVRPGDRELALDAWVLALGAVGLATLVDTTRSALPEPRPSALDADDAGEGPPPETLPELARVSRVLALGLDSAFDVHYRLRPLLREVAEHRLATRLGIDLDGRPDAARAALGEELWELVRKDRERPRYHFAKGLSLAQVEAALARLEAV